MWTDLLFAVALLFVAAISASFAYMERRARDSGFSNRPSYEASFKRPQVLLALYRQLHNERQVPRWPILLMRFGLLGLAATGIAYLILNYL